MWERGLFCGRKSISQPLSSLSLPWLSDFGADKTPCLLTLISIHRVIKWYCFCQQKELYANDSWISMAKCYFNYDNNFQAHLRECFPTFMLSKKAISKNLPSEKFGFCHPSSLSSFNRCGWPFHSLGVHRWASNSWPQTSQTDKFSTVVHN